MTDDPTEALTRLAAEVAELRTVNKRQQTTIVRLQHLISAGPNEQWRWERDDAQTRAGLLEAEVHRLEQKRDEWQQSSDRWRRQYAQMKLDKRSAEAEAQALCTVIADFRGTMTQIQRDARECEELYLAIDRAVKAFRGAFRK